MIPLALAAALVAGWLAGAAANWAADALPARDDPEHAPQSPAAGLRAYLLPAWRTAGRGLPSGRPYPRQVLLHAAVVLVFLAACLRFAPGWPLLAVVWACSAFFLTVLVIDLETRRVLNVMLGPAAALALLFSFVPGMPGPLSALLGGAIGLATFLVLAIVGRGAMGMGDVKLAAVIGLVIGFPGVLRALALGIVFGGLAALLLLVTRRASRKSTMAYAPYLAIGALVLLFYR